MPNYDEDTEWNDILRSKGIIPEKEFTEEQILDIVDETMEKKYGLTAGGEKLLEACSLDELKELEDEIDLDEDDRILEQYKKQRMAEMQQLARKEIFGSVTQISKPDWQVEVTDSSKTVPVVILLFQNPIPACKLLLAHMDILARTHRAVKFLKIIGDQCIPNYPDRNCPTLIIYKDGDICANLVGIQSLGGINTRAYDIERLLVGYGVIEQGLLKVSGGVKGDSDDEDEDDDKPVSGIRITRNGGRQRKDEGDDGCGKKSNPKKLGMSDITITIKSSNEANFTVTIKSNATVAALKETIAATLESSATPTPVEAQRLICAGRILKDQDTLDLYKISNGTAVHLARTAKPPSAASPATPAASAASATAASPSTPLTAAATAAPTASTPAPATDLGTNPFAALLGGGGNLFAQPQLQSSTPNPANPYAAFGGGGGAFGAAPPAGAAEMLQNPQVAAAMAGLMANPQFMDMMIATNPQLANMPPEMRQFMQSDQFRQIMSNPEMVRSMMQMAPLMGGGLNPFAAANGGPVGAGGATGAGGFGGALPNAMNPTAAGGFDPALLQMLMGGGAGAGAGGFGAAALPPPPANPEEAYQVQLRQLQDMGFYDASENIRALTATRGNVEAAVEYLFANPPPGHR
ncbi:hypothetical protein HK100_008985 [Physocladia obscura]|uniref:Ubiquitin-like protein n=1 Tax=Physocladia obscura TaxID=109957 RepID=A0AAD5TBR3_9FUNG|nr:hypothetical protein HK100_008985 [Physocladia obscura]